MDGGDRYFIKTWRRRNGNDEAIRALWNREVRGITRLQGQPGAAERFVRLHQLGVDERQFYAVLDGGRREQLSEVLSARSTHSWLSNLTEVGRRRSVWEGLLKIAEAVTMLHREGTLHRHISPAAVFVSPDGEGDFRLSGFEWSLRVAGTGDRRKPVGGSALKARELDRDGGEYSTATDWFDFGVLAAYILGASVSRPRSREEMRQFVDRPNFLNRIERKLLNGLLAEQPEERTHDGREVVQGIRDVLSELGSVTTGAKRDLVLAFRIGPASRLSEAIRRASAGAVFVDSVPQQLEWLRRDLGGDVRVVARSSPSRQFILRGAKLSYRVKAWTRSGTGVATWTIGFCEAVEDAPDAQNSDVHVSLGDRRLDITTLPEVRKTEQRTMDRAAPWDRVFSFGKEAGNLPKHLKDILDFFRVTQQLETALTVAQICPVKVVSLRSSATGSEIEVTPVEDISRTDLAEMLKLRRPTQQLQDSLELGVDPIAADDDGEQKKVTYALLSRPVLARDADPETQWNFRSADAGRDGRRYRFATSTATQAQVGQTLYLARNFGGTIAQLRRRHKAIEAMRSHEDLLRALADPMTASRVDDNPLPSERVPLKLDGSKLIALDRMWQTQPTFAIQGPPGTGKTTLIKGFADRLLNDDPSAQMLVTAHSHHTVDDVLKKLADHLGRLPAADKPIIVRLGKDDGEHSAKTLTATWLDALASSELARKSRADLTKRLDAARRQSAESVNFAADFRSMQLLVQDAANITLSTSNSGELAELGDRGRRFDWSVIEEAGKAHGFDMALALEASHRLVLIGDHEQLPPFNSATYKQLLAEPLRVSKALTMAARFAPTMIDGAMVRDDDANDFAERCEVWRENVDFFANLFNRSKGDDDRPGPAMTLTDQHRMHPHIAEVVGRSFYPNPTMPGGTNLQSPPATHERSAEATPFATEPDSWLPGERVVWVDVPYVQKVKFAKGETAGVFTAPVEANALLDALAELRAVHGEACHVQILSPYNDQLKLIARMANGRFSRGQLANMTVDPFDLRRDKRLGATVDEFQGSEADVVIVSLVRNNGLVPQQSVGFLKHANRMNVLMSRARHKLIVVGSWDFWASRCDGTTSQDDEHAYIGRMMAVLSDLEGKTVRRVGAPK